MRKLGLTVVTIFAFFITGAIAQSSTSSPGGTGSSPAAQNPDQMGNTSNQQPGYGSAGNTSGTKAEKKIKGCIQSQGGQYMLQTKSGKSIPLTGQDVSAHNGHEVAVHGTWTSGSGSSSNMSGTSSGMGSSQANAFNVTSIDHISDTCGGSKHGQTGDNTMQPK